MFAWNQYITPKSKMPWKNAKIHNDHSMEMFSELLAHCERNPQVTGGFPSQVSSNSELWWFPCCYPEQAVEQILELPLISWHHDINMMLYMFYGSFIQCVYSLCRKCSEVSLCPFPVLFCVAWRWDFTSLALYELNVQIFKKICVAHIWKIITISDHNFAHATTALLSWHVQNCDLNESL